MKAVSDSTFTFWQNQSTFTATMGTRLYPLVAKEDVTKPFAVYSIEEETGLTKDADNVAINLTLYFDKDQYATCTAFTDACKDIIKNSEDLMWNASTVTFIEEDQSIAANINYEINY